MSDSLGDIAVFVAAADSGRLAHAARALGISPAAVSAALKRLETSLGAKLMLRTTRSLRLTQEGERYLAHARGALESLRQGRLALASDTNDVRGLLRITAPADFGRNRVAAWLDEFAAAHPNVQFQMTLDDAVADFFRSPIDLALRYGRFADSSLIAQPVATLARVLCAAPGYLARRGTPERPLDLVAHDTICYMVQQRAADRWRLSRGDDDVEVQVRPRWVFNDAEMVRRWAIRGNGVAYRILSDIAADVENGKLQRVLPEWHGEPVPLSLVYPDRKLSPALRLLIGFLTEKCGALAS
ncbi:LysR family transcriptional regulator [Tahibacter soli]|uniref:LysR family transcriptional regulator n=1 Tax=Tahibacter soli TaxID=2983605 RepID=A0A9X4BKC1_9GAMM|nr:LysR family transcriptional regulator [Tahibacter soli]MDC8013034.1 LysR family transcriptional regulator [Tahibacter soli]